MKELNKLIPSNINWEYLKRFKTIVDSQNYHEACEELETSHAVLTTQMSALEKTLNFYIFERVNKNKTKNLTIKGRELYEVVTHAFDGLNLVCDLTSQKAEEKKLEIKIYTTLGLANTILADIIGAYLSQKDDTGISFVVEIDWVSDQLKDYEISFQTDLNPRHSIIINKLFKFRMNLYASKEYLKKNGIPSTYEDLLNHKFLAYKTLGTANANLKSAKMSGINLKPIVRGNTIDFLYKLAIMHCGIVELPTWHPYAKELERVLPYSSGPEVEVDFGYTYHSLTNDKFKEFVEFVVLWINENF